MSNHFHLILRTRPDVVAAWSDREVARRWLRLCPGRRTPAGEPEEPTDAELDMICNVPTRLVEIRRRLSSISWLMRMLAEPLARRANREDAVLGSFWQGRFRCVKLCDESAVLACDPDGEGPLLSPVYSYAYNARNELIGMTLPDPDGEGPLGRPEWTYERDELGQLRFETDPIGRTTEHVWNSQGFETETILPDPDGAGPQTAIFTRVFDVLGNLLEETDANGYASTWEYDLLNRLITYTQPDADGDLETEGDTPAYHYFYDDASQLTSVVDPLSRETVFDYNALGYRTSVTLPDPDGDPESGDDAPTTTYSVDTLWHVTSVVDAMQNETQFAYDHLYRVSTVTGADPDGEVGQASQPVVHYSWDLADQLLTTTDPMGRVVRNSYDLLGRLTSVMLPDPTELGGEDGPVRSFSYDALDRLTDITDADPEGDPESGADSPVTSVGYDGLGRIVMVTLPDPDGENAAERPFYSYAYNDASELTSVTDAMDRTTDYQYNPLGFRTHVILADPDGEDPLERPEYVTDFDPMGNVVSQTDPLGHTVATTFDHLYRPITITQAT